MSCQLYSTDASCHKDAADQEAEESGPLARWQLQPKVCAQLSLKSVI